MSFMKISSPIQAQKICKIEIRQFVSEIYIIVENEIYQPGAGTNFVIGFKTRQQKI